MSLDSEDLLTFTGPDSQAFAMSATTAYGVQGIDDLAKNPSNAFGDNEPKRVANRQIDGVTFYHLTGPGAFGGTDEFGTSHADHLVQLTFMDFAPAAQRKKWVESVLATFEWQ